jgi:hypothetical protein
MLAEATANPEIVTFFVKFFHDPGHSVEVVQEFLKGPLTFLLASRFCTKVYISSVYIIYCMLFIVGRFFERFKRHREARFPRSIDALIPPIPQFRQYSLEW